MVIAFIKTFLIIVSIIWMLLWQRPWLTRNRRKRWFEYLLFTIFGAACGVLLYVVLSTFWDYIMLTWPANAHIMYKI